MNRPTALYLLSTTVMLLPLAFAAHARGSDAIQPQQLPLEKSTVVQDKPVTTAGADFKGPPLTGLRVTTPADTALPGQGIAVAPLPGVNGKQLEKSLHRFIGQPMSQQMLNDITRAIVIYYKKHVGLLVDVMAPAGQDITDGRVRFVVVEAKLGGITSTGNTHFKDEQILSAFTTKPGDAISTEAMLEDLDWANRNPFRRTNLLYRRGTNAGETDIILQTADRRTTRVYAGANDTGTNLTGNARIFTGFNLGNVWCCGHQLNYQFTASDDLEKMQGHALSYTAPLPWRHLLTLSGSYQEVNPDVPLPMKSEGFAYEIGADYTIPLWVTAGSTHDVVLGYDFKRSNNNLEFGGVQVFNTAVDISQFSGSYHLKAEDRHGDTAFRATAVLSPGGATDKNTDSAHNIARAGASADYFYTVLGLERTTLLPRGFQLITESELQLADKRLPGSEQMTIGGSGTVRGYDEGETSGDSGFLLRNEVRAPAVKILGDDALTLLGFVDYGIVRRNALQAGETQQDGQLSVGPGLRYRLGDHVDMRAEYGFPLRSDQANTGHRAHLGLTLSY